MNITHPFSQSSIFQISIQPSLTGHWPDMSCLFEHSCLSSNKQIFNWIIGLDLLTRNLSLRSNALCYFSWVIVGWMGAIAGWYKYFRFDNPVMFRFALCPNTQPFWVQLHMTRTLCGSRVWLNRAGNSHELMTCGEHHLFKHSFIVAVCSFMVVNCINVNRWKLIYLAIRCILWDF